jgi:hypothetical protein
MDLIEQIKLLEDSTGCELIKIMEIDNKTNINYIFSTFINILYRYKKIKVFILNEKNNE